MSPSLFRYVAFVISSFRFRLFVFSLSSFRYGAFVMSPRNNEKTKWHKSATIEVRSQRPLPSLCFFSSRSEKQDSRTCLWLDETFFFTSPLKPLNGWLTNPKQSFFFHLNFSICCLFMAHRRYCTIRYPSVGDFDTDSSSLREMDLYKSHKTNAATTLDVFHGIFFDFQRPVYERHRDLY